MDTCMAASPVAEIAASLARAPTENAKQKIQVMMAVARVVILGWRKVFFGAKLRAGQTCKTGGAVVILANGCSAGHSRCTGTS